MPAPVPPFALRTLGTLSLTAPPGLPVDGVVSAPRRMAMLTYLAIHAQRALERRDTLVALFWPEASQEAARHSLRSMLHALRRTLPGLVVTRGDEEVGIERGLLSCDVADFESALAERRHADALDLYAGEFLGGFHLRGAAGFTQWAEGVRARVRERAVEAASYLARAALDGGDPAALGRARQAVELSGGREPQVRLLIEALALAGDVAEALREYEALSRGLREDYGAQPSAETEALVHLFRRAGTGDSALAGGAGRAAGGRLHNLPTPATPFIGREREIAAAAARIGESRLVTILGPGGAGKTRLALEVSRRLVEAYRDGAWFVPVAGLSGGEHLPAAISASLRVPAAPGTPTRLRLLDYLAGKEMLLVLDSFEHLAGEGRFVAEILEAAPEVRVLVTSQARLGIPAETLLELWGMEVPGGDAEDGWREAEVVRLFAQAARRVDPAFALTGTELPDVVRICRFAGGFPLGVELAAAWIRLLSPREIAAELETGAEPTAAPGGLPDRQRSLRASFEHAWHRLPGGEREVLARLSVFRGSMSLRAAAGVAGATLPVLNVLADRSLLRRAGAGNFEVPEVLRRYAEEKLREEPSAYDPAAERHAAWYLELLAGAEAGLESVAERAAAAALEPEIDHVRAAWEHAVRTRAARQLARSARAFFLFLDLRVWCEEGYAAFAAAVESLAGDPDFTPEARECELYLGVFALRLGRLPEAEARLSRVLGAFERSGEQARAAFAGHRLGTMLWEAGRPSEAGEMYERSMRRFRALGDERSVPDCLTHLGNVAQFDGRVDEARELIAEAIALQRRSGDLRMLTISLNNLGCVFGGQGRFDLAEAQFLEGLHLAGRAGDQYIAVRLLHNLAQVSMDRRDLSGARAFAERSLELSRRLGFRLTQAGTLLLLGDVAMALGDHADAAGQYQAATMLLAGSGAVPLLLEIRVAQAELERERGNPGAARALAAEALEHPGTPATVRARATSLLQSLEAAAA
jgi:predicted ATPase/DNA-binding SARP family transcriptional activator/Tfp pilus assembly protein PilF